MLTEEFGAEAINYWEHWKKSSSFSDITKKNRSEIESTLKQIKKFTKKHKEVPNDLEILKFLVNHLMRLAELIATEKWQNKKGTPDIYMKSDNFFHKIRMSLESIKAYGLMLEFNVENNLENRANLDLDFLKEIDDELKIYERKLLKKE